MRRYQEDRIATRLLLLTSFLNGLVFYGPVSLLVRTRAGITVSQFFILQIILSISILAFEVPAGLISDRVGYKRAIVFSQGLFLAARLLLLLSKNFWLFALEAVIEGIAISLNSGTDSAYLYSYYQGKEYTLFSSKMGQAGTMGFILSTLAYFLILQVADISCLVAATCISTALAFLTAFFLPKERMGKVYEVPIKFSQIGEHLAKINFGYLAILSGVSIACLAVNFFYAVKLERIGSNYDFMTFIILGYSAFELLAPAVIKSIKTASYWQFIKLMLALAAASFCGIFLLDSGWCILLMLLPPLLLSIIKYLVDELINESIDESGLEKNRATVLSVFNMANNMLEVGFLLVSSMLIKNEGNGTFLLAGSYLFLVLGWIFMHEIKKNLEKGQN